ncbi:hypothetical protein Tdes44962_MAKER09054, partial [Teratosphaeria destructans]
VAQRADELGREVPGEACGEPALAVFVAEGLEGGGVGEAHGSHRVPGLGGVGVGVEERDEVRVSVLGLEVGEDGDLVVQVRLGVWVGGRGFGDLEVGAEVSQGGGSWFVAG